MSSQICLTETHPGLSEEITHHSRSELESLVQVRGQLEVLMSASEELMACGDFMILLRAVLTLGNHLNEGTMRGSASGACAAAAPHALPDQAHPSDHDLTLALLACHILPIGVYSMRLMHLCSTPMGF